MAKKTSNVIKFSLYSQTIIALILATVVGIVLNNNGHPIINNELADHLTLPCTLIIKALRTLATPLIFLAIIHTFLTTDISGKSGRKLSFLIISNTIVAVIIGSIIVNLLHLGSGSQMSIAHPTIPNPVKPPDFWSLISNIVPDSLLKPLVNNNIISLAFVALAFGIALRVIKNKQRAESQIEYLAIERVISLLLDAVKEILNWVIVLVPIAVFGIVSKTISIHGFTPFKSLGSFVIAVLLALALQSIYYLIRLKFGSWVSPQKFIQGISDALIFAFSTACSTATREIAFDSLINKKVGLRKLSSSLGVFVGGNFSHDGTALYTVMSALFISQVIGHPLDPRQQLMVMLTSIITSLIDAGLAGYGSSVTMVIVFTSVGLPTDYVLNLIAVDWFLDRCRTVINVMGNMTVSALIDGKYQEERDDTIN
jgi:Na+/H+-dicarboxylate symporter